jgi:hypothetical protein
VDISLNHDVMASNDIISTPQLTIDPKSQNCGQPVGLCNDIRVHSYALETAYLYIKKLLYVIYGCEKQSEVDISLNHHAMASFSLHKVYPEIQNLGHLGGENELMSTKE